mmetsp:Transcript_88427/g.228018  ORF Transcript_88427/g.228018 Transcript_88427/m.228018 type:complete len:89 (-) Transcript_88427:51-317(-)
MALQSVLSTPAVLRCRAAGTRRRVTLRATTKRTASAMSSKLRSFASGQVRRAPLAAAVMKKRVPLISGKPTTKFAKSLLRVAARVHML